jgi:hypothetical protein
MPFEAIPKAHFDSCNRTPEKRQIFESTARYFLLTKTIRETKWGNQEQKYDLQRRFYTQSVCII